MTQNKADKVIRKKEQAVLGLIFPCYNEEMVLPYLLQALETFINEENYNIRVLFIDDGSRDETYKILTNAVEKHEEYALLSFRRNFGHQAAVSAGLQYICGDAVVVMDADLQDPLEVIPQMLGKWEDGYDVVYGVRRKRKENVFLKMAYHTFYCILHNITDHIPMDAGDFALMDRSVVDLINTMPEHNRFVRGLRGWVGGKQVGVEYERFARQHGSSKYSLRRLVRLATDGIFSFSIAPLKLATWIGFLTSVVGVLLLVWAIASALFFERPPSGWTSLAVMILFFGGVQLVVLGIVGEYIGRIYDEVKNRPKYIVQQCRGWISRDTNVPQ